MTASLIGAAVRRLALSGFGRAARSALALSVALSAPLCALLTYIAATQSDTLSNPIGGGESFRVMLVVDFLVALLLAVLVVWRIALLIIKRRRRSSGSRLHLRIVRLFTILAAAPAMLLGLFAAVSVTFVLEGWYTEQVAGVVRNSVDVARSYALERRDAVRGEAQRIAEVLGRESPSSSPTPEQMQAMLYQIAESGYGDEVFILNSSAEIVARGSAAYLFRFSPPSPDMFAEAQAKGYAIIEDERAGEMRALAPAPDLFDVYVYLARSADPTALRAVQSTRETVARNEQLERERGTLQLLFAGAYIGFALMLILGAIWVGVWISDRLVSPIARLAEAANSVAAGDLRVRVLEEKGGDEIALLSRAFNRMTADVKGQQDALRAASSQIDERRRFIETVLAGVGVGVLGVDAEGAVNAVNRTALRLLRAEDHALDGRSLLDILPEAAGLVAQLDAGRASVEGRVALTRGGEQMDLLIRLSRQGEAGVDQGYVATLDDMTDLVSAQRMAAWGDVARRVAHEIKNPLTPIQLSSERLRRKFGKTIQEDRGAFDQCIDTIIRQVDAIRRMVDDFSNFARMPEPSLKPENLAALIQEAAALQQAAQPEVRFNLDGVPSEMRAMLDWGMMTQVVINLLKNAAEAIAARIERDGPEAPDGEIRAELTESDYGLRLTITDNGVGLPQKERRTLTEPYVTTRKKGTGLGLAIVKRIVEQHGGRLSLGDAAPFAPDQPPGAAIVIDLPTIDAAAALVAPEAAA